MATIDTSNMPFSENQLRIMAFPRTSYDAIICDGAIRSGKTSIMTIAFVDWAMDNFDNKVFAICGKTVGSAIKNIIVPYMQLDYTKDTYQVTYNRQDSRMEVYQGNRHNTFYVYGGKDEASFMLIQGGTWAGVFLDEVVLLCKSFVNQALARCSVDGSRFWFSCNPGSPRHWFYNEWILQANQKNALYIHFDLEDNPSLSHKIIARYKNQYTGVFYDRYIRGLWCVAEGLVYPYDTSTITYEPSGTHFDNSVPHQYYISCDYGITNPFAALLWRVERDCAYCVDEYVYDSRAEESRRTDEEHYAAVEMLAGDNFIETIIIDPSATSFKETILRHGVFEYQNAKNAVISGIATTSALLKAGLVKISPKCKTLIAEHGLYRWNEAAKNDTVIKENDHCCDAERYFCETILKNEYNLLDWAAYED